MAQLTSPSRRDLRRGLIALACLFGGGCGIFFPLGATDGGAVDAASRDRGLGDGSGVDGGVGFGRPTLLVTVDGQHFGPSSPDGRSGAALVNERDGNGRLVRSTFRAQVVAQDNSAGCTLAAYRSGDDIAPIGGGAYQVLATVTGRTAEGTVDPLAGEAVAVGQVAWSCELGGCNGAEMTFTAFDRTHVEGYLRARLPRQGGGAVSTVTCAFWLPWIQYQP